MFDPNPTLDALLQKLLHPQLKEIDPGLDRMLALMQALGNPQLRLPPVVHVAGTNGKGSLIAYLRAILKAAGYRVHAYISPHLVHFNERILLEDTPIANNALIPLLERVLALQDDYPATFFEATTAAAFLAFSEYEQNYPSKCEARSGGGSEAMGVRPPQAIILLETGMGGRLDATNIIPHPAVVAITPIGMDHAEFLGNTIAEIAGEKAGIIKAGCPVVMGVQVPEAAAVIAGRAAEKNATLHLAQKDAGEGAIPLSLQGYHQQQNAATAIAVIRQLNRFALLSPSRLREGLGEGVGMQALPAVHLHHTPSPAIPRKQGREYITDDHIRTGLQSAQWPARLQPLTSGYWRDQLPEGWQLYLDGGHNPHAAAAIAIWAKAQRCPVYLIIGMLSNKDLRGYLAHWQGVAAQIYGVAIPGEPKSYTTTQIVELVDAEAADSVEAALSRVKTQPKGVVLICGSLYLAGHILVKN